MEVQTQALHVSMKPVFLANFDKETLEESVAMKVDDVERWLAMAHIKSTGKEVEVDTLGMTMMFMREFTKHVLIIDTLHKITQGGGSKHYFDEADRL